MRKSNICNLRHENEIFAYCSNDEMYVCEDCYEKDHRGHIVEYLKFLSRDLILQFSELNNKTNNMINENSKLLSKISKKNSVEKMKLDLFQFYDYLITSLKSSYVRQVQKLYREIEPSLVLLEKQFKSLSQNKTNLMYLSAKIKNQSKIFESKINNKKFKWLQENQNFIEECKQNIIEYDLISQQLTDQINHCYKTVAVDNNTENIVKNIESLIHLNSYYSFEESENKEHIESQQFKYVSDGKEKIIINKNSKDEIDFNLHGIPQLHDVKKIFKNNSLLKLNINQSPAPHIKSQKKTHRKVISELTSTPIINRLTKYSSKARNKLNTSFHSLKSSKAIIEKNFKANDSFEKTYETGNSILSILYYFDINERKLVTFNPKNNENVERNFSSNLQLGEGFASIFTEAAVFYLTGGEIKNEITSVNIGIQNIEKDFQILKNMQDERRNHAMIKINRTIYVIAGYNKKKSILRKCEKYDIIKNNWIQIAPLNDERNFLSSTVVNKRIIYVFGGNLSQDKGYTDIFEKYDTESSIEWNKIIINKNEQWSVRYGLGSIQISNNEILIFGGLSENEYYMDSFIFDIKKNQLTKIDKSLMMKEAFYQREPLYYQDKVYIYGFWSKVINIFDIKNKSWTVNNEF